MREPKHETQAKRAKMAIGFITTGAITVIWSTMWLLSLILPDSISAATYIASGIIVSGIAVVLIGMKMGRISCEVNQEETPEESPEKVDPKDREVSSDEAMAKANDNRVTVAH